MVVNLGFTSGSYLSLTRLNNFMRCFISILILSTALKAQDIPVRTGDISLDFSSAKVVERGKYSVLKAGLMSGLIPGSGQIYTGSYLKSALFFIAEIASWSAYFVYSKKGDEQTRKFKQYADENWSVVRYTMWMNEWMEKYGTPDAPIVQIDQNESLKPWQRVDWSKLNEAERYISRLSGGFSHTLPYYGEQQYYELIGKYHQYAPGWNDFDSGFVPEDVRLLQPTEKFKFYSLERGKANDFYSIASTSLFIVVANHVLSAIDAVVDAAVKNKKIKTKAEFGYDFNFGLRANLKLRFDF